MSFFFHIPHIENDMARVPLFDGLPQFLLDDSISHTGSEKSVCFLSFRTDVPLREVQMPPHFPN